jgi:hypothetical protein
MATTTRKDPPPITASIDTLLGAAREVLVATGGRGRIWSQVRNSLVRVLQMHQFLSERERREGRQQQR